MQVILIKYIQVFCFALFLSNKIRCDIMSLDEKEEDHKMYEKAACAARCLESGRNKTLEHCYNNCKGSLAIDIEPIKQVYENLKVNFICRGDSSFVLQIAESEYDKKKESIRNGIYFQQEQKIYVFKISEANSAAILTTKEIYLTDSRIIEIQNLTAKTVYNISAAVVHSNNEFSVIAKRIQFSTLEKYYKPDKISGISLYKYNSMDNETRLLSATINWKPAIDMTCFYEILYYATATNSAFGFVQAEVKAPKTLYNYKVENLTFGTEYQIGIRGKNPKETSKESDIFWYNLWTPTCLEWYENDLSICPPLVPEELNVTEHYIDVNKFSINVTWKKPALDPDYYIIKILDLSKIHIDDLRTVIVNISKDFNSVLIPTVILYGVQYEVHLVALSTGGNSSAVVTSTLVRHVEIAEYRHLRLVIAIVATILSVALLSVVVMVICQRRAKCKRYQERCKYFEDLDKKAPVDSNSNFNFMSKTFSMLPSMEHLNQLQQELGEKLFINDELEINRSDVEIFEILGEGAFGLVKRGILKIDKNTKTEIAVKMLKDHPTSDDIKAFRREIDVMKAVGKHPNIVGIVGHCTKDIKEMLLLTEFCSLGNLLNFLRSEWKYLNKIIHRRQFSSVSAEMEGIEKYKPHDNSKNQNIYKSDFESKSTSLIINRSYEISVPCTSACKCHVDIISNKCLTQNNSSHNSSCHIKIQNCDCNSTTETLLIENKGYYKFLSHDGDSAIIFEERQPLRSVDLLHIAKQISMGMEFLAKNKVVHRDLAARNILVCKDRTVKIADFGLSRDVYQENMYKKTGSGKLPIKWLALESMTHQVYTTQSDVWSYGVLLFEIVTLGGTPYPLIPTNKLLNLLKKGYRMEKPKNCGQEIYNLMLSCWNATPNERPNFTSICKTMDDLITSSANESIISLNFAENNESKSRPLSEESYLKPL